MTTMLGMRRRVHSLLGRTGTPVTLATETAGGTYDPATDTFTAGDAAASYVTGRAMRVAGDPTRYEALGLVQSEAPTLVFVPDVVGQLPPPGATLRFGESLFTVRDVDPVAPDGVALWARLIVVGGGSDHADDLVPTYIIGDAGWIL